MSIALNAILPALVVPVIAFMTRNSFWTAMSAFAVGTYGAFAGQSKYSILDLSAVAIMWWLSSAILKQGSRTAVAQPAPQPAVLKAQPSADHGVATLVGLIVVAAVVFLLFTPYSQPPATKQAPPASATSAVKQMSAVPPAKAPLPVDRQSQMPRPRGESKVTPDNRLAKSVPVERVNSLTPLEQCLTIPSDAGMSRCLERLKQ